MRMLSTVLALVACLALSAGAENDQGKGKSDKSKVEKKTKGQGKKQEKCGSDIDALLDVVPKFYKGKDAEAMARLLRDHFKARHQNSTCHCSCDHGKNSPTGNSGPLVDHTCID